MDDYVGSPLEIKGAELVRRLGGVWQQCRGMCRCPAHDDRRPSLSVRIGHSSLLFKCFAGCSGAEVASALRRLKLEIPVGRAPIDLGPRARMSTAAPALKIWNEAHPLTERYGGAYFSARGISHRSPALRFHPRTALGSGRAVGFRPAVIAAVREGSALVAIQRLFLDASLARLATDLENAKRTLGRPLSGAVQLHPAAACLGLAEGIETAESAAVLLGIPVWASLGNERLAHVAIPDRVTRLILLPDDDAGGRLGVRRAHQAHRRPGRVIETLWPWDGHNDWNDVLTAARRPLGGVPAR